MLEALKEEVCEGNLELPRHGLVTWTSGNLSARDPQTGLVVIKPSGLRYERMTPEDMVVVDLDGKIVEGKRGPSSDTASHLYVYRRREDVGSVVHTHSTYATAWAATGRSIPCCLTAMADEFGGPVPCGGYLLAKHGVFTIGPTIEKAVQAAVMVEDVARTVAIAKGIGEVAELPAADIEANYDRYTHRYGTAAASRGVSHA